jgi:hypothetical protein
LIKDVFDHCWLCLAAMACAARDFDRWLHGIRERCRYLLVDVVNQRYHFTRFVYHILVIESEVVSAQIGLNLANMAGRAARTGSL